MVKAAVPAAGRSISIGHEGETSALLGGDIDALLKDSGQHEGHASIASCISNLANTIIGSGMLTFPLAMASSGILPGVFTCMLSGGVAAFGLYLLSLCASKTRHRHASFHAVAQLTFPRAAIFFDAAIAIKCFGVSISYLIIIKSLMPNVVESIYHDLTSSTTNPPGWALNGGNWITLFLLVLIPLSFLRKLDHLRHTSYVALFSVAYLVIIVVSGYFWPLKNMPPRGEIRLIHFTPTFISTFPVQIFAFTCAQNLFPLYNEIRDNSQKNMNLVIGGSIGSATITYEVIAVLGYLTFGSNVGANIIAMYPPTSLFIAVGQLAIVVLVLFSYPLQSSVLAMENEYDETAEDELGRIEMSPLKHTILTGAIVAIGFAVAYVVDDLKMVLSFVGSTGSTTISFILPGLLYWKLTRHNPETRIMNLCALALMVYGCFILVLCLGYNLLLVLAPGSGRGPDH